MIMTDNGIKLIKMWNEGINGGNTNNYLIDICILTQNLVCEVLTILVLIQSYIEQDKLAITLNTNLVQKQANIHTHT